MSRTAFPIMVIGIPVLTVLTERRWQTTGDEICLDPTKRSAKGTAILFAVGPVSGTVLSLYRRSPASPPTLTIEHAADPSIAPRSTVWAAVGGAIFFS